MELRIKAKSGKSDSSVFAETALRPEVRAAMTMMAQPRKMAGVELSELVDQLSVQQEQTRNGESGLIEDMLLAQAQTLDSLFHTLATKAIEVSDYGYFQGCMSLAFKAQRQACQALATLAAVQHPKSVSFVRQANVQVNHGVPISPPGSHCGSCADSCSTSARNPFSVIPENELCRMT